MSKSIKGLSVVVIMLATAGVACTAEDNPVGVARQAYVEGESGGCDSGGDDDDDCPPEPECSPSRGYRCPSDNEHCEEGRCEPGCRADTCWAGSGTYCNTNPDFESFWACEPGCTLDSSTCPVGTLCSAKVPNEVGTCVPGCTNDDGCPFGMICNVGTPYIVPEDDPNPPAAGEGLCVPGCRPCPIALTGSPELGANQGRACQGGDFCDLWRVDYLDPIRRHRGCADGMWCSDDGLCVQGQCETSADCPGRDICVSNQCVSTPDDAHECDSDYDCRVREADCKDLGQYCNTATHTCQDFLSIGGDTDGGYSPGVPGVIYQFADDGVCSAQTRRPFSFAIEKCMHDDGTMALGRGDYLLEVSTPTSCGLAAPVESWIDCREWCGDDAGHCEPALVDDESSAWCVCSE